MALKEVDTSSVKRIESEQFEFENKGDSVHGTLLEKATLTSKKTGKNFQKYTVASVGGGNVSFLGGYQIDKGLADASPGTEVRLTLKGTKKLEGGRTMKEYKIEIDSDAPARPSAAQVVAAHRV